MIIVSEIATQVYTEWKSQRLTEVHTIKQQPFSVELKKKDWTQAKEI